MQLRKCRHVFDDREAIHFQTIIFFPPLVLGGGLESGRSAPRAAGAQARLRGPSSAFRQWVWTSRKLCRPVSVNTCPNPPRCPPATHTSPALPTGLLAAGQRSVWSSIMSNLFPNSESSFSLKLYWNLVDKKKKHHTSVVFILNPEHRHASLLRIIHDHGRSPGFMTFIQDTSPLFAMSFHLCSAHWPAEVAFVAVASAAPETRALTVTPKRSPPQSAPVPSKTVHKRWIILKRTGLGVAGPAMTYRMK